MMREASVTCGNTSDVGTGKKLIHSVPPRLNSYQHNAKSSAKRDTSPRHRTLQTTNTPRGITLTTITPP